MVSFHLHSSSTEAVDHWLNVWRFSVFTAIQCMCTTSVKNVLSRTWTLFDTLMLRNLRTNFIKWCSVVYTVHPSIPVEGHFNTTGIFKIMTIAKMPLKIPSKSCPLQNVIYFAWKRLCLFRRIPQSSLYALSDQRVPFMDFLPFLHYKIMSTKMIEIVKKKCPLQNRSKEQVP